MLSYRLVKLEMRSVALISKWMRKQRTLALLGTTGEEVRKKTVTKRRGRKGETLRAGRNFEYWASGQFWDTGFCEGLKRIIATVPFLGDAEM